MDIKFSIIVPIYNSEKTIKKCLDSILSQTYKNFEIILINDGSTDNSYCICKEYSKLDNRIQLINSINYGVSHARNIGLKKSIGDYILFIDSDDYIDEKMLQNIYFQLLKNKVDVIITGITVVEKDGKQNIIYPKKQGKYKKNEFWKSFYEEQLNTGIYGYVSNKIYNKDIIKSNNIFFNENMKSQEDYEFALNVYNYSQEILFLHESYYIYLKNESSRNSDILAYLNNHIKLKNILLQNKCYTNYDKYLFNHNLQYHLFCYIYTLQDMNYSNFCDKFNEIYDIDNINKYVVEIIPENKEIGFIIKCIMNKNVNLLYIYLKFRRKICKLLKKEMN